MKLTEERIIDAGLETFAEVGYGGLSMRLVAERLDSQAGSLYYHVKSKAFLLQMMADKVTWQAHEAGRVALAALPVDASWPEAVEVQLVALRQVIHLHPGGATLLAESPKVLSTGALSLMERLLGTLRDAGVPAEHLGVAADTLLSHVTGFVLQEQSETTIPELTELDVEDLHVSFPLTMAASSAYGADEQFLRSVRLICAGIEASIA
jgi:TetR/AcrR family tetracycline transcriptional repressor